MFLGFDRWRARVWGVLKVRLQIWQRRGEAVAIGGGGWWGVESLVSSLTMGVFGIVSERRVSAGSCCVVSADGDIGSGFIWIDVWRGGVMVASYMARLSSRSRCKSSSSIMVVVSIEGIMLSSGRASGISSSQGISWSSPSPSSPSFSSSPSSSASEPARDSSSRSSSS